MLTHKSLIHSGQRGFTLIEMLAVVALIGIIAGGIAMTISQIVTINRRASNHMIAVRQVQQAGDRLSKDVLQAQPNSIGRIGRDDNKFMVLAWWEFDSEGNRRDIDVEYELVSTNDGLSKLRREYSVGGEVQAVTNIAQYIVVDQTDWEPTDGKLVITITARVGGLHGATEQRIYEVEPRPTPPPDGA
ncbi:MAG: type II secretion system protein [Dehalococcoidia bacterium]